VGNDPINLSDPSGKAAQARLIPAVTPVCVSTAQATVNAVGVVIVGAIALYNEVIDDSPESPETPDSESGNEQDPADKGGKLTKSGRALQEHGSRPGSAFPTPTGDAEDKNRQAQGVLEEITNNPDSTSTEGNRFGGTDVTAPDGKGTRFDDKGKFRGFLEPKIGKRIRRRAN
jgi:hypothetical protein